jgi:nitrogen-specific signal transduction histidine kinase/CheY-like chemotaxis protein
VERDAGRQESLEAQLAQAQKMETVGQLASGVAHDFNNQLTVVLGYCDLLRRGLAGDGALVRLVDQISRAADRAAGLTRHLLAFSRKHHFQPQAVDLNRLIEEMAKPLARLIGEDVRLEFRPGEGVGPVAADLVQLEQIILNLAINARDAMPQGGRLVIETAGAEVRPEETAACGEGTPGPHVVLTVSDTGVGMDADTLGRAFEPFFTTKPAGRGTGLGLPMVRECVRQHGGHIRLTSEPGRGTTFRIYFPRAEVPADAAEHRVEPRLVLAGTETVLVGEDDTALRNLVVRVLRECGYRVLEASDGAETLKASRNHRGPIDLLVADVVLPEMSGPSLADCLRRERPGLRVLFMSGYGEAALAERGLRAEELDVLAKPFGPSALAKAVRRILVGEPAETGGRG